MQPNTDDANAASVSPEAVVVQSDLFSDAAAEIDREKWFQSEQAGYDKGVEAKQHWVTEHWNKFVRARLFEHLHGRRYWTDFGYDDFGLLNRAFKDDQVLLDCIIDRFQAGQENLDVIVWADAFNLPEERVHNILLAININRCRIYYSL